MQTQKYSFKRISLAGIYIHIPFCKKACNYCNFHFATSLHFKQDINAALLQEIALITPFNEIIDTLYFGGGTPSIYDPKEIETLIAAVKQKFVLHKAAEITLEANPDDLTEEKLAAWKKMGINRLSIGVQSFHDSCLTWMNRAHVAAQSRSGLALAQEYFDNITIDLIYGTPGLTDTLWEENVKTAIALRIPHLSCYALTVEPQTPLYKQIEKKQKTDIDNQSQANQFLLLMQWLQEAGYEHYEISNFCLPGHRSKHNSAYWRGRKYHGVGPSAHSYDGSTRWWNIANNQQYIKSIKAGILPVEKEVLTPVQQVNEQIMISLRTMEVLDLHTLDKYPVSHKHPTSYYIRKEAEIHIKNQHLIIEGDRIFLSTEGKLLADGIAADLFLEE